jgi:pantoate--beta-alanine ligase
MIVFESPATWRHERIEQIRRGLTLGFVPTMGAIHEGHLSLVRRSRAENERTLVSIFLNPTQFDDPADLTRYPRTVEADVALLDAAGTDFVFLPNERELYPDDYRYRVTENKLSTVLEGASRPGHFEGVLTVVLKLLNLAAADRAYFGEKDWQQLALVQGMAEAFFLPTAIIGCPTVRDSDGLALSSRNRQLALAERKRAPDLYRSLRSAASADDAAYGLRQSGFHVEYVKDHDGRRLAAVRLGHVRLIDNVPVRENQ